MPIIRSSDYSKVESWREIFQTHLPEIEKAFTSSKIKFYENLNLSYKFFELKNNMLLLTLTLEKERVKCDSFVIGMNRDWHENAGIELSVNDFRMELIES